MKNIILLFFALSFSFLSFSQGLKGEIGFNDINKQQATDIVSLNEFNYVLLQENKRGDYNAKLVKVDTLGDITWSKNIEYVRGNEHGEYYPAGYVFVQQLEELTDGNLILNGVANEGCDVGYISDYFVRKIDTDGVVLWEVDYRELNQNLTYYSTLSQFLIIAGPNSIFIKSIKYSNDDNEVALLEIDIETGELLNHFENEYIEIKDVYRFNNSVYGTLNSEVVKLDEDGEIIEAINLGQAIKELKVIGSNILIKNDEGDLTLYNSDFEEINSFSTNGTDEVFKVKSLDNGISVLIETEDNFKLIFFDESLNYDSEKYFDFPEDYQSEQLKKVDFNSTQLGLISNFDLADGGGEYSYFGSVRYVYYSMNNPVNEEVKWVDASIEQIEPYYVSVKPWIPDPTVTNMYNFKVKAKALVKNNGDYILENVNINHFVYVDWICGFQVYFENFKNLSIAPGESVWLDLGLVHQDVIEFNGSEGTPMEFNLCVFTSNPNGIVDLNVLNDKACHLTHLGTVNLEEHVLSNKDKKVTKIVNILGQEVKPEPNKLLIYIYDDGTSEKKMFTE